MIRHLVLLCILIGIPFDAFSAYSTANLSTASDGSIEVIPLEATAVETPPSIQIKTYAPGTFSIYRKAPSATTWGNPVATGVTLATGGVWSDTAVSLGTMNEYKFVNTSGAAYGSLYPTGYILAGIKADQTSSKGRMAVVVASDVFTRVPAEYAQYKADLVADGWTVHEIPCPRGNYTGVGNGAIVTVKVNAGGTGFTTSQTVFLSNAAGKKALGKLTVASGTLTSVAIPSSPSSAGGGGFAVGDALTVSGNSGATGYDISVATIDNSGAGRGVVITAGGSGYHDNDSVTIAGVTSGATAKGSVIVRSGTITGVSAVLPSTFTAGESLTISASAGGNGAAAIAGNLIEYHLLIRSAIQAIYNAYPGELQSVVMVGRVPVCRSGLSDWGGADGHGNEAPYAADAFYADMDGVVGVDWTDTRDNYSTSPLYKYNLPGDNQFDQQHMYEVGNGRVELGFGRIDFSNDICNQETESLRSYFNKLHRYKTASPDFLPGRRVCDRFGYGCVREAAIMSMPSVVGMANIEPTTTTNLPPVNSGDDPDAAYSADHGPYLFYFKGASVPANGTGGKGVLWTGMQSHYGYWYVETLGGSFDTMQSQIAEDNYALSWTWSIWGLRYIYHRMGMGLDAGDMMKQSINNTQASGGTYAYKYNSSSNGDYSGAFFMNNMGDPALRLFMFSPPSRLSVVKNGASPSLSWIPSTEPSVIGYHIYRKPVGNGSYARLTSLPLSGTTYTDATVSSGAYSYMVRAVRLETSGGGTFYNASLGIEQSIDLSNPAAPISITSTSLPDAYWNTPYLQSLSAQGGVPQFTWSVVSGALPPGLSLSSFGVITGTPTTAGVFTFTVQAIDQVSASTQQVLSINTNSDATTILTPEATTYTNKSWPTTNYGAAETNAVTSSSTLMYETFQRFNLSGVNLSNGFIKAKLRLYVTTDTASNVYALVQGNLLVDALDGWVESGRSVPFETTFANNGANKIRITCFNHGFSTGNSVTIAGFSATPPNGLWTITKIDDDHFDIPVTYSASYTVDPALAYATALSMNYNNRPTLNPGAFNTNVPTLSVSGSPVPETFLEMDVTSFVTETLKNDPEKLMSIRLFTTNTGTVWMGSRRAYGAAQPRLIIETSDAPAITFSSPFVNPVYVYAGSGLKINTAVTPIPARAGFLSLLWSKISGPGTVTFSNTGVDSPTVTFSAPGTYVLRLSANDGVLQSNKDINVVVMPSVAGVAPSTGPNDSLRVRLPLDENSGTTATDLSGVTPSNNGVLAAFGTSGNPTWTPTGAPVGGALAFNGDNQYVEITDSTTNQLDGMQKMSMSFWIYTNINDNTNSRAIAVKRASPSTTTTSSYSINLDSKGHIVATIFNKPSVTGNYIVPVGQWCHVVVMFDGSLSTNNLQIYINGTPDKFGTITGLTNNIIPHFTSKLRIGTWFSSAISNVPTQVSLNGMVDEFRIYNRVLSLSEIQDLATGYPSNTGPVITLSGSVVNANVGQSFALNATVTDDGSPSPLQVSWLKAGGLGDILFIDPAAASTSASIASSGNYTLRLTASDGAITTFADVMATITATPYQQWLQANGLPTDGSGSGAPMAIPLNDGVTNAMKFALGIDLDVRGYGGRVNTSLMTDSGEEYLVLAFTAPEPAPAGVSYIVKTSSDLVTWSAAETQQLGSTVSGDGFLRTTTVRDTQPVHGNAQKRFIRLETVVP